MPIFGCKYVVSMIHFGDDISEARLNIDDNIL